jgi:predicted secreted protein
MQSQPDEKGWWVKSKRGSTDYFQWEKAANKAEAKREAKEALKEGEIGGAESWIVKVEANGDRETHGGYKLNTKGKIVVVN